MRAPRASAPLVPLQGADVSSLDLGDELQNAVDVTADVCDAGWVAAFLLSEESRLLHCVATSPAGHDRSAEPLDADVLWSRVVRRNRLEVIADVGQLPAAERQVLQLGEVRTLAALPILINGRCRGVLVAGRARPEPLDPATLDRCARQARVIAAAVERANLYQEATQRLAELSLLHEVGRAFNESLELSSILETCADQLVALLDSTNCFILLQDGEDLRGVAASGPHRQRIEEVRVRPGEASVAALALRERRAIVVVDAEKDPRVNQRMRETFQEKSVLAVPMSHRGHALGVIVFDEARARRLFTPAEIERASLIASHLAAAVDNARLYEDLRRSYADLAAAQAKLVQRERLAALGELAAQVAHEVRNPLGAIFNVGVELKRRFGTEGELGYLVRVLEEEGERINRIVGDLLDFARPMDLNPQGGGLTTVLLEAEAAVLSGSKIKVELDLAPGLEGVALDPRLMRQAIVNLLANAHQALGGEGSVRITAHVIEVEGRRLAEVIVEDSGPGMEAGMRERVFEPFFTTKASGIGLGLAVVKRIAEAHQGEVRVRASPLGGAAFVLRWAVLQGEET